jgi:predicted flavoprotein YhiN
VSHISFLVIGKLLPFLFGQCHAKQRCPTLVVRLKQAAQLSKKELQQLVGWLKAIPLHVIARGAGDEFVTAGGVELKEVDPSSMESKLCPGLFFAGEILNIDGFTGGFNLQASWATGRLAGMSAAT